MKQVLFTSFSTFRDEEICEIREMGIFYNPIIYDIVYPILFETMSVSNRIRMDIFSKAMWE